MLVEVREFANADDGLFAPDDRAKPHLRRRTNPRLHASDLDGLDDSALCFERLENRPGLLAELLCERLKGVGPERRIDWVGEVRLLDEHQGFVAGDAARGAVGFADGLVPGCWCHDVGTAEQRGP